MALAPRNDIPARLAETETVGGMVLPAFLAIAFGVVEALRHGMATRFAAFTYVPLLFGGVAVVTTIALTGSRSPPRSRVSSFVTGALSAVPLMLSLYVMLLLGGWGFLRTLGTQPYAWGHALFSCFCGLVGWRGISASNRYGKEKRATAATCTGATRNG